MSLSFIFSLRITLQLLSELPKPFCKHPRFEQYSLKHTQHYHPYSNLDIVHNGQIDASDAAHLAAGEQMNLGPSSIILVLCQHLTRTQQVQGSAHAATWTRAHGLCRHPLHQHAPTRNIRVQYCLRLDKCTFH